MFTHKPSLRALPSRRQRSRRLILEGLESRTAPTANVFRNVADEVSLRNDIAAADSNGFADNVVELTGSIRLSDATAGQLVIANATSTPKTLTIVGQGPSASSTVISGSSSWNTRIFEVVGTTAASVTVVFKDLEITGGKAQDGGVLGGNVALGVGS